MMQKFFLSIIIIFLSTFLSAQIPTSCFEIESILVDACANPEGENEMVRFTTGPNPLNLLDLSIQWPNFMNPWLGTCQDAVTASKIDSINQTIQGCGILIEPASGMLPAGSKVLLITSTKVQPLAHSFNYLNDTLYVIFQCDSNTAGHFANTGSGDRTLIMSFSQPLGCADTVTYDRALLVNVYDSTGGTTASQNGSSVSYNWDGAPSYYNSGCVAPFIPVSVNAGNDTSICEDAAIQLQGMEQPADSVLWKSNQGTFNMANILNPIFTPNLNESYPILITLTAYTPCDSIIDSLLINKLSISISAGTDHSICMGESTQLNSSGANSYSWSLNGNVFSNQPNPIVSPVSTTSYVLTGSDNIHNCVAVDSVLITVNQKDSLIISSNSNQICKGQQVSSSVSGGNSYIWFPDDGSISEVNAPSPILTPQVNTTYFVASSGSCTDTASITITVLPNDSIVVNSNITRICMGDTAQLSASGANSFIWSPDDGTLSNIAIPNPLAYPLNSTVYRVMSFGTCPDTITISIDVITLANIIITPTSTTICAGESIQLNVSGSADVIWFPTSGLSCTACTNPVANPTTTTTFIVSDNLCSLEDSVTITVNPIPVITTSEDASIQSGESVTLTASGGSSYSWSPDESLDNAITSTVIATPLETTIYTVTVSDNQCEAQASIAVMVIQPICPQPLLPSAFSPNGDNKNDMFGLINTFNYASMELHIYNRWGENVFSSTGFERWDGFYKGDLQPIGAFVYMLTAICPDSKKYESKGSVSLLR